MWSFIRNNLSALISIFLSLIVKETDDLIKKIDKKSNHD